MTPRPRHLPTLLAAATLLLAPVAPHSAAAVASLPDGVQRVLFLGDSITYGGGYVAYIETYFLSRHPGRALTFRNAGLSSETVSGLSEPNHAGGAFPRPHLHERLGRVLERLRPDFVLACYGMNDGIYLPFDESRFAAFRAGLDRLREAVRRTGADLLHLTPPLYVDVKGQAPAYAAVLDRYAEWLVAQRAGGWNVADLHTPMARELAARRTTDPRFTFARDGVHPGEDGHWLMARETLRHLGASDLPPESGIDALLAVAPAAQLLPLVRARMELWRDAWLTATGHTRPRTKAGLPLDEAHRQAEELDRRISALLRH